MTNEMSFPVSEIDGASRNPRFTSKFVIEFHSEVS